MGLDLTLLPARYLPPDSREADSIALLRVERREGIFRALQSASTEPVPEYFGSWFHRDEAQPEREPFYGNTPTDAYGRRLQCIDASRLAALLARYELRGLTLWQAAYAYIKALPPTTPIALYWH